MDPVKVEFMFDFGTGLQRCVERRDKIAELIDKSGERPT